MASLAFSDVGPIGNTLVPLDQNSPIWQLSRTVARRRWHAADRGKQRGRRRTIVWLEQDHAEDPRNSLALLKGAAPRQQSKKGEFASIGFHALLSEWPPLERVATELNDDVSSQPTNAARRWASTSTVVLGSAGN